MAPEYSSAMLAHLSLEELRELYAELRAKPQGAQLETLLEQRLASEQVCMQEGASAGGPPETSVGGWEMDELERFIPVRLSEDERRKLCILERALEISEYTDKVDVYIRGYGRRAQTIADEFAKFASILRGLWVVAGGEREIEDGELVRETLEIGRRYKLGNPDKMRTTFGKLMWLVQDAVAAGLISDNGGDIKTVAVCGLAAARRESIGDYVQLEREMLVPVTRMRELLESHFATDTESLSIRAGVNGARLSHSHKKQFEYVRQSLVYWEEVLRRYLLLVHKVDLDLVANGGTYRLMDTGQGLNRVQYGERVYTLLAKILAYVQRDKVNNSVWIGSGVIHLGDHNVPNVLFLLDKYVQIPRILAPIVAVIDKISQGAEGDPVRCFLGGKDMDKLKRDILADFFKHAFDGSGADNFYDAGSCIDGRLTSAWNWCSKIDKKPYYPAFLLSGFTGFDGQ